LKILISTEIKDEKRAVHIDDNPNPDFHVEEQELKELLKESRYGHWSDKAKEGA
jgi:hypothetical protein